MYKVIKAILISRLPINDTLKLVCSLEGMGDPDAFLVGVLNGALYINDQQIPISVFIDHTASSYSSNLRPCVSINCEIEEDEAIKLSIPDLEIKRGAYMQCYYDAIDKLRMGDEVVVRMYGHTMKPLINNNQKVKVMPSTNYQAGDIIMCKLNGKYCIRTLGEINGDKVTLHNANGQACGTTDLANIVGKCSIPAPTEDAKTE